MSKYFLETSHDTYRNDLGQEVTRDIKKVVEIDTAQEPFYLTFLNYVGWMYDIRGNVALNVMSCLMDIAGFNTGIVSLSPAARRRIKDAVGISDSALARALRLLVEKGALKKTTLVDKKTGEVSESRGEYLINPQMFWKGELSKRKRLIVEFRAEYNDAREDSSWNGFSASSTSEEI